MKTVITYGTFDLFHIGDLELLRRAKALGDRLIVGVSTDEFAKANGYECVIPYEQRVAVVAKCAYVDAVIKYEADQERKDITENKVDILVMDHLVGKFDALGDICSVVYVNPTDMSPAIIKAKIEDPWKLKLNDSEKRFGDLNIQYQEELQRTAQLRSEIEARDKIIDGLKAEIETFKKKK